MSKTIEERVDAVVTETSGIRVIPSTVMREILQRHFTEPWLDKPDGPGWWWRLPFLMKELRAVRVIDRGGVLCIDRFPVSNLPDAKWQRVIGPSE